MDRAMHFTIIAGAHHVVHDLAQKEWGDFLRPIERALKGHEPAVTAPPAAANALQAWEYDKRAS